MINTANDILLKEHEVPIMKCGALALVWITTPAIAGRYEIRTNDQKIAETNNIVEAFEKYNSLV